MLGSSKGRAALKGTVGQEIKVTGRQRGQLTDKGHVPQYPKNTSKAGQQFRSPVRAELRQESQAHRSASKRVHSQVAGDVAATYLRQGPSMRDCLNASPKRWWQCGKLLASSSFPLNGCKASRH